MLTPGRPSWDIDGSGLLGVAYRSFFCSHIFTRKRLSVLILYWIIVNKGGIPFYHFLIWVKTGTWRVPYLRLNSEHLVLLHWYYCFIIGVYVSVCLFSLIKLLIVWQILSKWSHILVGFVNKRVFIEIARCSSISLMGCSLLVKITT